VEGGFAAVARARAGVASQVTRVSRVRLEAALYHPPVPPPPGKRGRKPTKGARHRRLKVWAARADTPGQETTVDWYRGERKRLWVFSRTALWYTPSLAPVAMRFVGSVAKLIVTLCYPQLVVFFMRECFNIWYSP
jgi:hypothetical protein